MIEISLSSNAAQVLRQVQGFPPRMAAAIARAMDKQNQLTIGHSQASYLSGPRPGKLGVRTNRLRSSLTAAKAAIYDDTVFSSIGTNVAYAGVHERGFDGRVTVRSHTRKIFRNHSSGGVAFVDPKTGRIRKSRKRKVSLYSGDATVRSFSRRMVVKARPFLAPAIQDSALSYSQAISRAIELAWTGGKS